MSKTLITKLNGVVNNNSLLRVGELRITYNRVDNPTYKTQFLSIASLKDVTVEIIGNGYFTDKTLSQNLGKTMTVKAYNSVTNYLATPIYTSNGDYDVAILDKYSLMNISYATDNAAVEEMSNKKINIDDLRYCKELSFLGIPSSKTYGDLSSLSGLTKLSSIPLYSTNVTGDISSLSELTGLTSISLRDTKVHGDISSLSELTGLTSININNTNVTGNISSLANLQQLTSLNMMNSYGDISTLRNTKLKTIILKNSSVKGDLAVLPASCYFLSFLAYKGDGFDWTTRLSTSNIMAAEGPAKLNNVDKMLQDQANCVVVSGDVSKLISFKGTRTSASDAAVATLQSKGYTVSISPA